MTSRDAESKRAASEATALFQAHYPEFLVREKPYPPENVKD